MLQIINDIFHNITMLINRNDITIIGIDGLGGSGKSTISNRLSELLSNKGYNNIILHIDDFIFPQNIRYNAEYPEWQCYYNLQWRYDYLTKDILLPIKQNRVLDSYIELYDKEFDNYKKEKLVIKSKTIVIVEGIFLQRAELKGLFDYVIYIDVPECIRFERLIKRDTYIGSESDIISKYQNRYFPAERKYIEEYDPHNKADYVINNT